jgi:hypothetical protein
MSHEVVLPLSPSQTVNFTDVTFLVFPSVRESAPLSELDREAILLDCSKQHKEIVVIIKCWNILILYACSNIDIQNEH